MDISKQDMDKAKLEFADAVRLHPKVRTSRKCRCPDCGALLEVVKDEQDKLSLGFIEHAS